MKKLIADAQAEILAFWRSLPHQLQAMIVVFASAAATFLGGWLWDGPSCWTWFCLKHTLGAACGAGYIAVHAFYMRPGPGPHADESLYAPPGTVNDDGRNDPVITD